ncbi:DUF1707 SHOCT-like domain-containing protein [Salininema proteolyticum]|uniref:DUF1707 domain-containing protein n=1 Tax=Salininema proteolyticum TaxID=1607685 RepID=A0ABV8TYV5_9ACTN
MTSDPGRIRIADAERDVAVERLREATGDGRLTLSEFEDRSSQVYDAKTQGELDLVFDDLPVDAPQGRSDVPEVRELQIGAMNVSVRDGHVYKNGKLMVEASETEAARKDKKRVPLRYAMSPFIWGGGLSTAVWFAIWITNDRAPTYFWPVWPLSVLFAVSLAIWLTSSSEQAEE